MRRIVCTVLAGFAMSMAAHAGAASEPPSPLDAFADGLVQEQDVGLVFDYLRDALGAAVAGREPAPPPDELRQRAQTVAEEMKRRGEIAARALLDAIERSIRENVRSVPPTSSSQRTRI